MMSINGGRARVDEQVPERKGGSGSETICDEEDEEMTEEYEQAEEQEDRTDTDASSTRSEESDGDSEEIPLSYRSPEIQKFLQQFPEISQHFQILSKIGEGISRFRANAGTFSSVYKAVDIKYQLYDNSWDSNWKHSRKWSSPPIKRRLGAEPKVTPK
jgi:cell division control protein 7